MEYRCKHTVEAMKWTDTDECRELMSDWFDRHDSMFTTRGPIALYESEDGHEMSVMPGEWLVWSDDEFIAMPDEMFRDEYEADPLATLRQERDAVVRELAELRTWADDAVSKARTSRDSLAARLAKAEAELSREMETVERIHAATVEARTAEQIAAWLDEKSNCVYEPERNSPDGGRYTNGDLLKAARDIRSGAYRAKAGGE